MSTNFAVSLLHKIARQALFIVIDNIMFKTQPGTFFYKQISNIYMYMSNTTQIRYFARQNVGSE